MPFLASILLLGVGWYIRVKVPESPDFEKVKQQAQEVKVPAMQVFKNHPRELLTIIFARAAENACFYIASTFALAYTTTKLGIPRQDILFANDLWCRLNHGDDAIVWTSIRQSGAAEYVYVWSSGPCIVLLSVL